MLYIDFCCVRSENRTHQSQLESLPIEWVQVSKRIEQAQSCMLQKAIWKAFIASNPSPISIEQYNIFIEADSRGESASLGVFNPRG